jgi:hypothetical protein
MEIVFSNGETCRIANLTPWPLKILVRDVDGTVKYVEVPRAGVFRVYKEIAVLGYRKGIQVVKTSFEDSGVTIEALRRLDEYCKNNDFVIVDEITARFLKDLHRKRVIDDEMAEKLYTIGQYVKDEDGNIVGADSLVPILNMV